MAPRSQTAFVALLLVLPSACSSAASADDGFEASGGRSPNGGLSTDGATGGAPAAPATGGAPTKASGGSAAAPKEGGSGGTDGRQASGGAGSGGSSAGGSPSASGGGSPSASGGGAELPSLLGMGEMSGSGQSTDRYQTATVLRDEQAYSFIANGWGPGFESLDVNWNGTSFGLAEVNGSQGEEREAAAFPALICGDYSSTCSPQDAASTCGLPRPLAELHSLRTGMRFTASSVEAEYSAALDIWFGNRTGTGCNNEHTGYLMVWLRQPGAQVPRGELITSGETNVRGLPGSWDLWSGEVRGLPITNYVKPVGQDTSEVEFDLLELIEDARARGLMVPGDSVMSIAAGFSIWNGPVRDLSCDDFYVLAEPR